MEYIVFFLSSIVLLPLIVKNFDFHLFQYPICGPTATRLGTYIKGQYATTLIGTFELTLYIHALRENGPDKNDKSKEGKLKDIATQLQGSYYPSSSDISRRCSTY